MIQALLLAALAGCGAADSAEKPVDTGFCDTVPYADWNSFGQGFLVQNCQPCHASAQTDREGAPADVTFDTEQQARDQAARILARAAPEPPAAPDMPPQGGVSEEDRLLLRAWLECQ